MSSKSEVKSHVFFELLENFDTCLIKLNDLVEKDYENGFWKGSNNVQKTIPDNISKCEKLEKQAIKKLENKKWIIENQTAFVEIDVTMEQVFLS